MEEKPRPVEIAPETMWLALRAVSRMDWIDWKLDDDPAFLCIDGGDRVPVEEVRAFEACMEALSPEREAEAEVYVREMLEEMADAAESGDTFKRERLTYMAGLPDYPYARELLLERGLATEVALR